MQRGAVALLLATFAGLATWGAWSKSETYDEPMYIFTAYSYVVTGDLSLNREHPPLAKYLMGLPLLLLDLQLPDDYQQRPGFPFAFISHQPNADHHWILFLARMPGVLLGLLLGLYVLQWGRWAFGNGAGLVALLLYALNPNILAHCRVAANDFAVTTFIFAASFHVWRWLDRGSRRSLALGSLTLGCALGSKLTALVLLPIIGVIVLVVAIARRRPVLVGQAFLALFGAAGVLWLLYMGEARSLDHARQHARFIARGETDVVFAPPEGADVSPIETTLEGVFGADTPIPLLSFIKGFDHQTHHTRAGHLTYFWGQISSDGFWNFYLVSWLIKNPEAFSLLILLGLAALRRTWRGGVHEACLYVFVISQFLLFSTAKVQLGFKYILPVVPFLCVAAARVLAVGRETGRGACPGALERVCGAVAVVGLGVGGALLLHDGGPRGFLWLGMSGCVFIALEIVLATERRPTPWRQGIALLLAWAAASGLWYQPDNLMYFNGWAGGPDNGHTYSVIGDDWGQDTAGLGRWMDEQGLDHIYYDYYGTADPETWGVRSTPTFAHPRAFEPIEGLVAVHVTALMRQAPRYDFWLGELEPIHKIGHTIFIYDVTEEQRVDALFNTPRGEGR